MPKHIDLRDATDANYWFGELKLWRDTSNAYGKTGVIVEAHSNQKFFRKLLHRDCKYFPVEGWEAVVELLTISKQFNQTGVIGIIDADFKRLNGYIVMDGLFLTDGHDTEIMLAHSDAWGSLVHHYCAPEKLAKFEKDRQMPLLDALMELLKPLSTLRLVNEENAWGLVFRTRRKEHFDYLEYKRFIPPVTMVFSTEEMFKVVENKSNKPNFFKVNPDKKKLVLDRISHSFDPKELSNGHDLMNIFALALEKALANFASSTSISGEQLERELIIAYRLSDFEKTELHKSLYEWESGNAPYKVVQ